MTNIKLSSLPINNTPSSSAIIYVVDAGISYQFNLSGITGSNTTFYLNSNPSQFSTSGNLQTTGTALQNEIFGLSGQFNLTGTNLNNLINGLSGQFNISGANFLNSQITLSGLIGGLSGQLNITGFNLNNLINGLSGQLNQTGNNLQIQINNIKSVTGNAGTILPSLNYNTTINWSGGNTFYTTLTGNTNFNFINMKDGQTIVVSVMNTGSGSYSGIWPNTIKWPSASIPLQSNGATDIYTFICITGIPYANYVQNF